jgi:hypothetical protein
MYECETWSVILNAEHVVVFKNMALGKLFVPKWEIVTDWRESGTVKFVFVHCYWGDELSGVCGTLWGRKKINAEF